MVYISIGIVLLVFGTIALSVGLKRHWREFRNGGIVLFCVGLFTFVGGIIAFLSRT